MKIPEWAKQIEYLKCPVCGEPAIINFKTTEQWKTALSKDDLLLVITAGCKRCGTEIAIRGKTNLLLKIIIK